MKNNFEKKNKTTSGNEKQNRKGVEKNKSCHHILYLALGGAGQNIITTAQSESVKLSIKNDNILFVNTDKSSLDNSNYHCLLMGEKLLNGHAAGGIKFGEKSIDESFRNVVKYLDENQYKTVVIISGAAGGTGGNAPYLASKLLAQNFNVALCLSDTLSFETKDAQTKAQYCIEQAEKTKDKLLFLKVFSPNELTEKLEIGANKTLLAYLDALNAYIFRSCKKKLEKIVHHD